MNNPSPLVPQGTQPQRGKSSLYFKILMILSVHVVLIGGMLLQGCKDTSKEQSKDPALSQVGGDTMLPSNTVASTDPAVPPINTAALSNNAVSTMPSTQLAVMPANPIPSPATPVPATVLSSGDAKEYVIAKGDTLGAIARRNSISIKALKDANPGVDPRKLKVGQKLQVPASTGALASTSATGGAAPATDSVSDGSATYTVKSGDTLGRIARAHGTSFKKIMALNDLKTTAIHVGQKLKLPGAKGAAEPAMPAGASTTASAPGPVASSTTSGGVVN